MLSDEDNKNFRHVIDSLRKSRSEPITDPVTGEVINHLLYEDPYTDGHLLSDVHAKRTAFIEGRRGTGKSTLLLKLQHEIRGDKRTIGAYIDGNKVVINANLDHEALQNNSDSAFGRKVALFSSFVPLLTRALTKEIERRERRSTTSLFNRQAAKLAAIAKIQSLNDVTQYIKVIDITGTTVSKTEKTLDRTRENTVGADLKINLYNPTAKGSFDHKRRESDKEHVSQEPHRSMRTFSVDLFVEALRSALNTFGIETLFVFLDDFCEIPPSQAASLMAEVIYPLEVAADELFKFKIAVYPGEYQIEPLERHRIDMISLDPYQMYMRRTGPAMESAASDYIGRLLKKRFWYFSGSTSVEKFFKSPFEDVCRCLFEASFCNPRTIGMILHCASEGTLDRNQPLSLSDIRDGARKHYERNLAHSISDRRIFSAKEGERDKIFVAQALLNAFLQEAKRLKNYKDSDFFSGISGPNPTSHFHCDLESEKHLQFLSDRQLIHFYRPASNKSGKEVSIYALDYGLCESEEIEYARVGAGHLDKDYYVQRVFNFSDKIETLCGTLEQFKCDNQECSETESILAESSLARIRFLCPSCRSGTMKKELRNLPSPELARQERRLVLSNDEFNVLNYLSKSKGKMIPAKEIGPAIDVSAHYVGKLARRLCEIGYINKEEKKGSAFKYELTEKARREFFGEASLA